MAATKSRFYSDECLADYTPDSAVTAGAIIQIGGIAAQAVTDIAASELGAVRTAGLLYANKDESSFALGAAVYWDNDGTDLGGATGGCASVVGNANFFVGRCAAAAGTDDTEVLIDLNSAPASSANADTTDSSGGTAAASVAEIEGTYTQATLANAFATVVAELNQVKGALRAAGIINPA